MSVFIPGNVCCGVIGIVLQTIGKNIAWKLPVIVSYSGVSALMIRVPSAGKQLCKFAEGMTDVVNILKEIQMVSIHVQDHTDLREKA